MNLCNQVHHYHQIKIKWKIYTKFMPIKQIKDQINKIDF